MIATVKAYWKKLRSRFWLALGFDVVVILLAFYLIHSWQARSLPIDELAPSLQLSVLDGQGPGGIQVGKPGVVYFFAPWCGYCRSSIDNLNELVDNGSVAWATTVALSYQNIDEIRDFIGDTKLTLPVQLGRPETATDWGIRAFPTYFVIDSEGRINSRSVGYSTQLGLWARVKLAD